MQSGTVQLGEMNLPANNVPAFGYKSFSLDYETYSRQITDITSDNFVVVYSGIHAGILPLMASVVRSATPEFEITAIKLPEETDRQGLIVRGFNNSDADVMVTLLPFRRFGVIDVVMLDESLTEGKLAVSSDNSFSFRATPHHLLTFWLHDEETVI
jgi:hypothetical protein